MTLGCFICFCFCCKTDSKALATVCWNQSAESVETYIITDNRIQTLRLCICESCNSIFHFPGKFMKGPTGFWMKLIPAICWFSSLRRSWMPWKQHVSPAQRWVHDRQQGISSDQYRFDMPRADCSSGCNACSLSGKGNSFLPTKDVVEVVTAKKSKIEWWATTHIFTYNSTRFLFAVVIALGITWGHSSCANIISL